MEEVPPLRATGRSRSRGQPEGSDNRRRCGAAALQLLGKGYEVRSPARFSLSGRKNSRNSLARTGEWARSKERPQGTRLEPKDGSRGQRQIRPKADWMWRHWVTDPGPSEFQAGMRLSLPLGSTWSISTMPVFRTSPLVFSDVVFLTFVGV